MEKKVICLIGPDESYRGGILEVMHQIELFFFECEEYSIVHVSTATKEKNKISTFLRGLLKYIKISLTQENVIAHIQLSEGGSIPRSLILIILSKLFKNKIILHSHGGMFYSQFKKMRRKKQNVVKYFFSLSDCVIVLTDGWKKIWERIAIGSKIVVIPNGIKVEDEIRKDYFEDNQLNLLFLGNISDFKGVYDLIDAADLLAKKNMKFRLKIAGGGEIEKCKKYVLEKNLGEYIEVLGWVEGTSKTQLLLASDVLILPSHYESFGIVVIEAMAYKIPVICGDAGFTKEIVIDQINGLVSKTGDIVDLAKKIAELNDRELIKKMGENGYTHVKNNYEINYVMRLIKSEYDMM